MAKIGLTWKLVAVLLLNAAVFIGVMVAVVHLSVSRNFEVYVRKFDTFESFWGLPFIKVQHLRQHGKYEILRCYSLL